MNRVWLTFLTLLFIFVVAVALYRNRASDEGSRSEERKNDGPAAQRIHQFWSSYREATGLRIAGQLEEAVESYRKALAINGDHKDALYYFGNVSFELGDFLTAESSWERLLQINPRSSRAHSRLGDLYLNPEDPTRFDLDRAETAYRQALQINKEETGPHLRLGQVALIRGDLTQANELCDAVLGSNHRSVEAHFFKGYIAWKTGRMSEAEGHFAKASEHSRARKPTQGVLGEGDTKSGRPMVARQSLFYSFMSALGDLGKDVAPASMHHRYRDLDTFLRDIRAQRY